ncbi:MAG: hypothetical protein ACPGUF_07625, partial [Litorivicinus sp.]
WPITGWPEMGQPDRVVTSRTRVADRPAFDRFYAFDIDRDALVDGVWFRVKARRARERLLAEIKANLSFPG